jgi:CheY-like chemotaxis protein
VLALMRKAGYDVELAPNGRAAVDAFERARFDAILMDCQMPEMDGFAATQAIRRLEVASGRQNERVPVIALTANAMKEDRARCIAAGMDDYVSKPIRAAELESVLGRWIKAPVERG